MKMMKMETINLLEFATHSYRERRGNAEPFMLYKCLMKRFYFDDVEIELLTMER